MGRKAMGRDLVKVLKVVTKVAGKKDSERKVTERKVTVVRREKGKAARKARVRGTNKCVDEVDESTILHVEIQTTVTVCKLFC